MRLVVFPNTDLTEVAFGGFFLCVFEGVGVGVECGCGGMRLRVKGWVVSSELRMLFLDLFHS